MSQEKKILELSQQVEELSFLLQALQLVSGSLEICEICEKLIELVFVRLDLDYCGVWRMEGGPAEFKAEAQRNTPFYSAAMPFWFLSGPPAVVCKPQGPIYLSDFSFISNIPPPEYFYEERPVALLVPIYLSEVFWGYLVLERARQADFAPKEMFGLVKLMHVLAPALENAERYRQTKELSWLDDLTKVYNRRYLQHTLEIEFKRAQRFERPLSLLMIDVDYFKKINDSLGHLEGDRILTELARLLAKHLREIDTLARYGGEEFAVILPDTALADAARVAFKLKDFVQSQGPNLLRDTRGFKLQLGISIGVTTLTDAITDPDQLLDQADIALYQAKSQGRNRVVYYQADRPTLRLVNKES